jgi:hypothetical protein
MTLPGPHAAYLRVYEPVSAFPEPERAAWASYASDQARRAENRAGRLVAEQRQALAGVLSVPPRPVPPDEERAAFLLEVDSVVHVCPVQSRLRSWVALGELKESLPTTVLHAFVPPLALERAEQDHKRWARDEAGSALRILTATWSVPLQWFVPFVPADRLVDLGGPHPTVVHRTRMSAARRRVARALRTLRGSIGEVDVADDVEALGRWLEEFHARSWLELDYAGLARLLGPAGVQEDTSVADVAAAVAALAAEEQDEALSRYATVAARWAAVQALERAN